MIGKIKKMWQDFRFNLEVEIAKKKLSEVDSFFTYPLLVSLEFNTEWYRERFDRGISVSDSVIAKADEIAGDVTDELSKLAEDQ